ncbi:hypothetical protein [Fluviispira sanaruensis]|uniref:Uncharacterized protein n=1 Tax=Fluviispira sanaruensis TaxID=2493639 RepID=A0A4P2VL67_FLUSA|nr:hypothetical protein [Fluviispira sanaruensis]BBH53571.1 hypothetical protein JCM31447_20150 [Fluviispira sanaruensis]
MKDKSYLSLDLDKISFADSTVLEYSINLSKKILKFKVDSVFYELDADGSGGLIGEVEFCFLNRRYFQQKQKQRMELK